MKARYPAAFTSVIGVGALPKGKERTSPTEKYEPSNYSNLGDKPSKEAVMTLGGEEGVDDKERNKGVLGLYLGKSFPRATRNPIPDKPHKREIEMYEVNEKDNPLAWWAGTSFATPILTGTIAAVLSSTSLSPILPFANTQQAIRALYANNIIAQAKTEASEDVMEVTQG